MVDKGSFHRMDSMSFVVKRIHRYLVPVTYLLEKSVKVGTGKNRFSIPAKRETTDT